MKWTVEPGDFEIDWFFFREDIKLKETITILN
jgi:hypothetical protein